MDEALELLFRAAASPFGIIIRSSADPRAIYQRLHQLRRDQMLPQLENLQFKAAGPGFAGEADFVIYKRIAQRRDQ